MTTYTPSTPRGALGCAAFLMSAMTFGLMVGGPAAPASNCHPAMPPVAARSAPTEVAISPSPIDVVALRPSAPAAPVAIAQAKRRERG